MDGQVILWTDEELHERLWLAFLAGYAESVRVQFGDPVEAEPMDARVARDAFEGWMRERAAVGL